MCRTQLCNQSGLVMLHDSLGQVIHTYVPRPTQFSIPPELVNENQLRLGRQRQVWFILFVDKQVGVQVKL